MFKVGDRVRYIREGYMLHGLYGIVKEMPDDTTWMLVTFKDDLAYPSRKFSKTTKFLVKVPNNIITQQITSEEIQL